MPAPMVAIVGSADSGRSYTPTLASLDDVVRAAEELGRALALEKLHLLVYSANDAFIERHVVRGYVATGQAEPKSIRVLYPRTQRRPQFEATKDDACFDYAEDGHDDWEVGFYSSIRQADALVLLGGGNSTLIAGVTVLPDQKPMLALKGLGGAAARVWEMLTPDNHVATGDHIRMMGEAWKANSAGRLVQCLLDQIEAFNEKKKAASFDQNRPEDTPNGLKIVWLSDLHVARESDPQPFALKRFFRSNFHIRGNQLTQRFAEVNLKTILAKVEKLRPDHILVTGDLTNYAEPHQFKEVRDLFRGAQKTIQSLGSLEDLDPDLWTILPGNHDITDIDRKEGVERRNLGMFFKHFGETFPGGGSDADGAFPVLKPLLRKSPTGLGVRIIGLDSNVQWPVWRVGINARGRIDRSQLDRLDATLSTYFKRDNELVLVLLHHHPVVVPHIESELNDYFLSLNEADGRRLVKLCSGFAVSAILHGHFHSFSYWTCTASSDAMRQMAIIGAPTGTLNAPHVGVEFMELREAYRNSSWGARRGLALYQHRLKQEPNQERWQENYLAFIE